MASNSSMLCIRRDTTIAIRLALFAPATAGPYFAAISNKARSTNVLPAPPEYGSPGCAPCPPMRSARPFPCG